MSEPGTSDASHQPPTGGGDLPGPEVAPGQPPADDHFGPPQLGIIHLLAWMTVTAVLLKLSLAINSFHHSALSETVFSKVMNSASAAVYAAGIVGFAVLVRAWRRGSMGRLQPGHWMILILAIVIIVWFVDFAIVSLLKQTELLPLLQPSTLYQVIMCMLSVLLVSSALWFWAARRTADGRRWKALFGLYCASSAIEWFEYLSVALGPLSYFRDFTYLVGQFNSCALLVALLVATLTTVLLDCARGPRRDGLHWLGVAVSLCALLIRIAPQIWFRFFYVPS
jgi:hypothetical protein